MLAARRYKWGVIHRLCYLTQLIPGHRQGDGRAHRQQVTGRAIEGIHRQEPRFALHLIADDVAEQLLLANDAGQAGIEALRTRWQQGDGLGS